MFFDRVNKEFSKNPNLQGKKIWHIKFLKENSKRALMHDE